MSTKKLTAFIIGSAVLVSLIFFSFPIPASAAHIENFNTQVAALAFMTILGLGSALLFLYGLKNFKSIFRQAYLPLCICLGVQGIGTIAYIVTPYMGLMDNDYVTLAVEMPLALSIVVMFIGLVRYSQILQIHTRLTNPTMIILTYIIIITAGWFWLHSTAAYDGWAFHLRQLVFYTEAFFYTLCAIMTFIICNLAGVIYRRSLYWFGCAMLLMIIGSLSLLGARYFDYPELAVGLIIGTPYIFANICLLVAGYAFNNIDHATIKAEVRGDSVVDSIVLLGAMASKPSEVDVILDRLRGATAQTHRTSGWNSEESSALKAIYYEIETYLVTKEPLRKFTRLQLRQLVSERFGWTP